MSYLLFAAVLLSRCRCYASGTKDHGCRGQGVGSCAECLAVGPQCAWCADRTFLEAGQPVWQRCDRAAVLLRRGCSMDGLEDPRGSTVLLRNPKTTSHPKEQRPVTQLEPQTLLLNLRPGEAQSFEVKFKRVQDYPVDLYYLMDLSFSMEDDLHNVKKLGAHLMEEMRSITSDFRMGFGAFVDKTVMPYISTAKDMLSNPCKRTKTRTKPRTKPRPCAPPFTFRHVLSLTTNGSLFTELVGGQWISGNMDVPEGGLDALMQAAVCEEQIGWRNVTRLLVFSTDAGFHSAGDGKLGGIVLPNDGKCHLSGDVYTRGNTQDYPSVAHIAEKLRQNNIQIIFAVTEEVTHLYEGLRNVFPKCAVGTLSNNSHNILQIIVEAYNALTSEVVLENSKLPSGYTISFTSHCKDGRRREQGRSCSNISMGDQVSFNVSITAPACVTAAHAQPQPRVIIKPRGYSEELLVLLRPVCECACQKDAVTHGPSCSHGNGTLECGSCRCREGRVGASCECNETDSSETVDSYLCRRDSTSGVCSGHGECICGKCVCHQNIKKPEFLTYYGQFCECNDFTCEQHRGQLCGGHGRCVCGQCKCFPGFRGQACECQISPESCLSPDGQVCAGRGDCHCGACDCHDKRFRGLTCELCPSCPSVCTMHRECVLCRAFSLGLDPKECETRCEHLNVTLVSGTGLQATAAAAAPSLGLYRCVEVDREGCRVHFLLGAGQKHDSVLIRVALERDCPAGPDVVLICVAVCASVVVLGVGLLLLWKLITSTHDRREYRRFQRELERRRWARRDNPIYRSAVTTTLNPKYKEH